MSAFALEILGYAYTLVLFGVPLPSVISPLSGAPFWSFCLFFSLKNWRSSLLYSEAVVVRTTSGLDWKERLWQIKNALSAPQKKATRRLTLKINDECPAAVDLIFWRGSWGLPLLLREVHQQQGDGAGNEDDEVVHIVFIWFYCTINRSRHTSLPLVTSMK